MSNSQLEGTCTTRKIAKEILDETDDFDLTYVIDYQLQIINRSIRLFQEYLAIKETTYLATHKKMTGIAKNWK